MKIKAYFVSDTASVQMFKYQSKRRKNVRHVSGAIGAPEDVHLKYIGSQAGMM